MYSPVKFRAHFFPKIDRKDRKLHCSMGVVEEEEEEDRGFSEVIGRSFRDCIDRELCKCLERRRERPVVLTGRVQF